MRFRSPGDALVGSPARALGGDLALDPSGSLGIWQQAFSLPKPSVITQTYKPNANARTCLRTTAPLTTTRIEILAEGLGTPPGRLTRHHTYFEPSGLPAAPRRRTGVSAQPTDSVDY